MRSKFTATGYNTVTHTGTCLYTGEAFTRRYWVRPEGGYVRLDDTRDGNRPGTLGKQPYTNGSTWECKPEHLLSLVKSEWRAERRAVKAY